MNKNFLRFSNSRIETIENEGEDGGGRGGEVGAKEGKKAWNIFTQRARPREGANAECT